MNAQQTDSKNISFWIPLFTVVLGCFAALLTSSSVNVALPKMMAIFGVGTDQIEWVLTAYMITSGVVIPITGFLGDYLSFRWLYIFALAIFTAGSLLCSISGNLDMLLVSRVVQAIGGGVIMPVSMTIIYKIVPREKIGTALGVWGVSIVVGPAIGPTLGGYIIDALNWRLLFSMNIPIGVLGLILALLLLPKEKRRTDRKLDIWGFILSTSGCFSLLLALSEGQKDGWGSQFIVTLMAAGIAALFLFMLIEVSVDEPMLELRAFKSPVFSGSVLTAGLMTMGLYGGVFLIPLFTQDLIGLTPMQTGLVLLPSALASAVTMPLSGFLFDRIGAVIPATFGLALTTWGTWELHNLNLNTSLHHIQMLMVVRSFGIGLAMMPINAMGMNAVARRLAGGASAIINLFRQIAGSFGIAILTSALQQRMDFHFDRLREAVSVYSLPIHSMIGDLAVLLGGGYVGYQKSLGLLNGLVQQQSFVLAIDDTFVIATIFILISVPVILFIGIFQQWQNNRTLTK
ncbi:DHA2 family efflux MFS transporter permease subunit [Desulfotomaculum copahuensis]|uniref:MFS transporter n=1 Tax=Desulfotomaculum copahuensis TaxID=1838280 RepID=A0A1B7LB98_9FIRM|nr:DHA2 family efflux MFS transporter permease subunit [Desulfotomaculum copahuensis]OAT79806.1 MFS transporter [Desulfotomaculum copahuensis]